MQVEKEIEPVVEVAVFAEHGEDIAHEIGVGRVRAVDAEAGGHAELFDEIGEAACLGDGEGGIDPGVDGRRRHQGHHTWKLAAVGRHRVSN